MNSEIRIWSLDELILANKVKLGRGDIISKKDIASFPGDYPIYSSAREKNGTFGFYGKYMFDEELITWSIDGGGRLFYRPPHKFSVTNVGGTLRILDKNFLNYRYLHLVLTHLHSKIQFDWVYKAHPSVIRAVYKEIPIPSLELQLEIVKKLDSAFAEIDLLEKNLGLCDEKANQLFQSLLGSSFSHSSANDKVGLKVVLLKDICLEVPRIDPKLLGRDTFKYLDIGSLSSNSRSIGDVGSVSVVHAPGRARQLLSKNDSVFSTVRPYMKKIAYIDQSLDNEIASTGFCVLRPDSKLVDPRFLYHYLYSDLLLDQVLPLQTGVSYPAIRDNDLKEASISLPALEKQREIAEKLDIAFGEIEKIKNRIAIKRDFVSILKQGLLSDAFPSDEKRVSA